MNNLLILSTAIKIQDIIDSPEKYDEETKAAGLLTIKLFLSRLYESKKIIEGRLIESMDADGATKLKFLLDGEEHIATLTAGKIDCKNKTADKVYKSAGFEPLEIGSYKYEPSWTKAKNARKLGGDKQRIIDQLFTAGEKILKIE